MYMMLYLLDGELIGSMKIYRSRVAIVGAGNVGASIAFSLTLQGVCAEVMLIDRNPEKAFGEVLDLQHSIEYLNRNIHVMAGSYEDCKEADIVVITASAPFSGAGSRLEMLESTARIVKTIVEPIMAAGFDGHFIVVSNPVDAIAHYVYQLSGLPKNQVIGTGTALDSARLKQIIAGIMNIDPRSVQAYVMGEHGDSQMVPWSHVRAGGKDFYQILADDVERFKDVDLDDIVHRTIHAGHEVMKRKNSTQYGIASATTAIIKAVLYDENRMIPVSTLLEGEYGEKGVFCGVPAILNRTGVKEIGVYNLTTEELARFKHSVEVIKASISRLAAIEI